MCSACTQRLLTAKAQPLFGIRSPINTASVRPKLIFVLFATKRVLLLSCHRIVQRLVLCRRTRPVANNLPSPNHLANREEANGLGNNNAGGEPITVREVPDLVEGVGGLGRVLLCLGHDVAASEATEKVLEVALESCDIAVMVSVSGLLEKVEEMGMVWLTVGSSFVPGRRTCRAQERLGSNGWSGGSMLWIHKSAYLSTSCSLQHGIYLHCMRPTKRPVRPPAFASEFIVPVAIEPTLSIAFPADDWTLVRPSDALDCAWAAFSFAAPVASEVDEALRVPARRTANVERRSTTRDAGRDIVSEVERCKGVR
jgi:hypothetical protein